MERQESINVGAYVYVGDIDKDETLKTIYDELSEKMDAAHKEIMELQKKLNETTDTALEKRKELWGNIEGVLRERGEVKDAEDVSLIVNMKRQLLVATMPKKVEA